MLSVSCIFVAGGPKTGMQRVDCEPVEPLVSLGRILGCKVVFCALSETPVGIDAEEADRPLDLRLADKILSPSERRRLEAAPCKAQALLRLWVLKESYAKLTGRGLGNYLWNTDFDPQDPRIRIIDGCLVAVLSE